ncbi:SH3 domain-containing protein [Limobrevibacterium gyesilva]|uniref:SH3 domain-containing protein n=1 Tax=Limobrevibacterium gyesilva TaxID=2991712 RepID=A0AA42CGG2_9PROT|nr:SH3 domain-containing protein [Limobrevibacterium gyesilva]MCW3477694.1 SH3 domain-containing protein [Limobrevibacterium gyesilva]
MRRLIVLCLAVAALPALPRMALAQMQPQSPSGVLQLPPKGQKAPASATPATSPPQPAPRAAVQQVAPFASPPVRTTSQLGHSAPSKPTPVVQPPANAHAQKPPAVKAGAKAGAAAAGVAAGTAAAHAAKPAPAAPAAPATPVPDTPKPAEPLKGTTTGQALPRWASLRSDEVNLRTGPGTRYPVDWVYRRRDLPVEIEREFEVWRLVQDQDGVKGWVHQATLTARRSFVVKGAERALRRSPSDDAAPVALLKPGVVGRIRTCEAGKVWCEMQVGDYRGWLKRDEVWGTYPGEAIN